MSTTTNPLVSIGGFLLRETEYAESTQGFVALFTGQQNQLENRWAGTAVKDKQGEWHIVRSTEHVQRTEDAVRVKIFSGGAIGRGVFKDAAWFKDNAEEIYFGALTLPEGPGSAPEFMAASTPN